ncbi:MAG: DegT/DnrJ/EryC1/StrS family aminotransferase [Solirubrobacterales bacterium]|nr:DegT/DnrJ/EryC1/StrS family aminotransferase [Solirubrobacterales bacterium]
MSADGSIPLARPVIGPEEEAAVLAVLRSGQLSLGPKTVEFEQRFAARLGTKHALAVSSGTAGLHLALNAVGVGPGDEVITSPFSFVASANAILYAGAKPVFVDVDPVSLTIDPEAAAAAVTERTAAFLPVDIFGMPARVDILENLKLPIVQDSCEALGAVDLEGVPVGGRGHPSVFGFYANKQMTTGEGGMVTCNEGSISEVIASERNQGRAVDMGWLDHDRLGYNYRLSEIAAAIGVVQLDRLDGMLAMRTALAELYAAALENVDVGIPAASWEGGTRGWFVYVVTLPNHVNRDAVILALRAAGVDCKPYLPALHLMGHLAEVSGSRPGEFPVAEAAGSRGLALPFFPGLTEAEVARVAESLATAMTNASGA